MSALSPTSKEFFDAKYKAAIDPWDFASSPYENARYERIAEMLAGHRFESILEVGCSIGCLTQRLASLAEFVVAIDFSEVALEEARRRCAHLHNVSLVLGSVATYEPDRTFEVIVFSEIGYYFQAEQLRLIVDRLVSQLTPGGIFLAAHWLGYSADHILSGDQVHAIVLKNSDLHLEFSERHKGFRLDKLVRH